MRDQTVKESRDKKRNRGWHKDRRQQRKNKMFIQSLTFKVRRGK